MSSNDSETKDTAEVLRVRGELLDGRPCVSVYYSAGKYGLFRVRLLRTGDGTGYEFAEWAEVEEVGGPSLDTFETKTVPPVVRGAVDGPVQVPVE